MGFREVRGRVLDCLKEGRVGHWPRKDAFRKNWLSAKRRRPEEIRDLLLRCNGTQYRESLHDFDPEITVHEFFPDDGSIRWYIKVFFDPDMDMVMFMSVHPSGE
jgi:hypothetical protein